MSAKKPTPKTTKSKFYRSLRAVILGMLLFGIVAAAAVFIIYGFREDHRELGQYNVSDPYIGRDIYKSLDLKLATKAIFPSPTIKIVKNLAAADGLARQDFSFEVKDDHLTEYGLMLTPSTKRAAQGYPVVILLHGYINADQYDTDNSYLSEMEEYAAHGFVVLKPDLRGMGLSIHSGRADSAYYSMSYNTDVISLISAVKNTAGLDKSNINLWGHSMGAYIALRASVFSKDVKNIIMLSGPVDSLQEMYLTYIPPSDENNPYALATRSEVFSRYGTPEENSRFWYDASPIYFVGRIRATLQIHVGLDDRVVPPRFSQDLEQALNRQNIRHQYFEYPDGGHSLEEQRPLIYDRSLKLMQLTVKTSPVT